MGVLQRFERRLEGLVQGAFTRAFGGWVEPVEVAAALTREAEDRKTIVGPGRVLVPNSFIVELARSDADRLREYDEPLRLELGSMVSEAAQEHGWSFVGPVTVRFEEVDDLDTGAFRIRSAVQTGPVAASSASPENGARLEGPQGILVLTEHVVVGRDVGVDLQLADSSVSRRHAELTTEDGQTEVRDLVSTNGTTVNDVRVSQAVLHDGDHVRFGNTEFMFRSGR